MFLLQDDKGTWLVLLEVSLASASHGAGFSLPGQSVLGNVVVLGVYCVSLHQGWTCGSSQALQTEVTSCCCSAIGYRSPHP